MRNSPRGILVFFFVANCRKLSTHLARYPPDLEECLQKFGERTKVGVCPTARSTAGGVFTCLTVRWWCLVVELQRKLDVPRRLREVNNSKCGCIYPCVRSGEVDGIKCIQEVRAELELKSLCDLEVFLQADIPVVVSGSAQMTELGCTGPERGRWVGIVAGIKPGEATTLRSSSVSPTPDSVSSVAIGA